MSLPNDPALREEFASLVEELKATAPDLARKWLALLTRAGMLQTLLADPATPAPAQATRAALPDPPPAPFEYTGEEIYDRQERAARFRGQRRPIEPEGSPWAS